MDEKKMKKAILELAELCVKLDQRGGPEKAGRLFEKTFMKQDDILEEFGLPSTPVYQSLLEFTSIPWDQEVDKLIALLQSEAVKYREEYGDKPELEILKAAKETKRDPMMVLPEIHVSTHVYTIWVYNNILLKDADTIENVLEELQRTKEGDVLDLIGQANYDAFADRKSLIEDLESKGFLYVRPFLEQVEDFLLQVFGDKYKKWNGR
jgi:hypothetical protein